MPSYGQTSEQRLATCHPDLQILFNEVIKYYDCQILYGERTLDEQMDAFKQGRKYDPVSKSWVISDKTKIVTYCDGVTKKSKHNNHPSLAVDVMPYPVQWNDKYAAAYFAGKVMEIYRRMHEEGTIKSLIKWGGDWNENNSTLDERLIDFPHYEVYN